MTKLLIFIAVILTLHLLKPFFNWFIGNPGMYTDEVGYLPWVLIVLIIGIVLLKKLYFNEPA